MKKFCSTIIVLALALAAFAPFAGACDPGFPNGVPQQNLSITIPGCNFDYQATNADGACNLIRQGIVDTLNADTGRTWTYIDAANKNEANFIVYVLVHETQPSNNGSDTQVIMSFKTFGWGLTADGHTLFTAVGSEGNAMDAYLSTAKEFGEFVTRGWTCNSK